MGYRLIEGVTWADYAFEAEGKTLNELFENAALALCAAMAELKSIKPAKKLQVSLENADVERLLFSFLEEILFLRDSEYMLFSKVRVKVAEGTTFKLEAVLEGDTINPDKQTLHADVKAITWHQWKFEKNEKGYRCQVVVDV